MRTKCLWIALWFLAAADWLPLFAQVSVFTYQGRLQNNGIPASGSYNLTFAVFTDSNGVNQVGGTLTTPATGITNGLFTEGLDFGPDIFTGAPLWLQIGARTNGGGNFTKLAPLQPLTPTPYAIYAENANAAGLSGTLPGATLPASPSFSGTVSASSFSGNGGGLTSLNGAGLVAGSVGTTQLAGGALAEPVSITGTTQTALPNTSYAATSASLTTINLPVTANVGDVVQITGEGAGGWAALAFEGSQGWAQTGAPTEAWQSVASSSDGTHLVAVALEGIWTSANSGETWTQAGVSSEEWFSVASSANGTHLVAVANNEGIWTSADSGVTWNRTEAPSVNWYFVASSSDGTHLVAVVFEGGIWTSADSGVTWNLTGAPSEYWYPVASSTNGTYLVAVANPGGIWTSANSGATWTQTGAPSGNWYSVASSADGTHLVAVTIVNPGGTGPGGIWTSANSGATWTQTGAPAEGWISVASSSDGTHLTAAAEGEGIWASANSGATWTQTGAPSEDWYCVASSADGTHLVAVVGGNESRGGIYTSGSFAAVSTGGQGTSATLQYVGNGVWQPTTFNAAQLTGTIPNGTLPSSPSFSGTVTAGSFSGSGSGLTSLSAANLTGALPAISGASLTSLNAAQLSGTIPNGTLPSSPSFSGTVTAGSFSGSGSGLTSLSAANLTGALPAISGASLTSLPASPTFSGTVTAGDLTVNTGDGSFAVVNDGGVPGVEATGGLAPGHLRFRNWLEVWPDNAGINSGVLDVRNTSGGQTIVLNGANGRIDAGTVYASGVELTSDRNAKENFQPVDSQAVLAKVASLPVTQWNYKTDSKGVQHVGPMAQDFQAAFGLDGADGKHISVIDEGGVALAAIQGLNQKLEAKTQAKDAEIQDLKQSVADLKKLVESLAEKK